MKFTHSHKRYSAPDKFTTSQIKINICSCCVHSLSSNVFNLWWKDDMLIPTPNSIPEYSHECFPSWWCLSSPKKTMPCPAGLASFPGLLQVLNMLCVVCVCVCVCVVCVGVCVCAFACVCAACMCVSEEQRLFSTLESSQPTYRGLIPTLDWAKMSVITI